MYVAEYELDGERWAQIAVGLTSFPREDEPARLRWRDTLTALLRAFRGQGSAAVRIALARGELRTTAFFVAPAADIDRLKQFAALFARFDAIVEDATAIPADRAGHDERLAFPPLRCRTPGVATSPSGPWLALDFRIREVLDDLLTEAEMLGHAITYHASIEPIEVTREWVREAAKNVVRLERLPGVGPALMTAQQRLAERMNSAVAIVDEVVGVETPEAAEWVSRTLEAHVRSRLGTMQWPPFDFTAGAGDDALVATRHRALFEGLSVAGICADAADADQADATLCWIPPPSLLKLMPARLIPAIAESSPLALDYRGMPPVETGNGPYVFVSYKREDLERIKPTVASLHRDGFGIWYDKGIPGGAEWDALLEERIQRCQAVLLFLSDASVRSKYVRREVKYADSLGKPLIGVRLDRQLTLTHGFEMLLNQYQVVNGEAPELGDELKKALTYVRLM